MTIEDETGVANLVIFPNLFEKDRKPILQSKLIMAEGVLQRTGDVIHVIVNACYNFSGLISDLMPGNGKDAPVLTLARGDEKTVPPGVNKRSQVRVKGEENFGKARNFR